MKHLSLAVLASLAAAPATASVLDTQLFDYPQAGVTVTNGSIDLDIASLDGAGVPDGATDLQFVIIPEGDTGAFALGGSQLTSAVNTDTDDIGPPVQQTVLSVGIASGVDEGVFTAPIGFAAGDVVDDSFQYSTDVFVVYDDDNFTGDFGASINLGLAEGESTFLGLEISITEQFFIDNPVDVNLDFVDGVADYSENGVDYSCIESTFGTASCFGEAEVSTTYGFLEITRGSLTPGLFGLNLTAGSGALIPGGLTPVPLPAAGWLLLAGVAGLGAAGRRNRKS